MKKLLLIVSLSVGFVVTLKSQNTFFNLYGSNVGEEGTHIANVPGGGYVVAGATDESGYGYRDLAVWEINPNGTVAWCRKFGTAEWEWISGITSIASGGFYVAIGSANPLTYQSQTGIVTKLDASGNVLWTKQYDVLPYGQTQRIEATSNGGFVLMTSEDSGSYSGCVKLIMCNSSGVILWSKMYLTDGWYYFGDFAQCANGDIVVAFSTSDTLYNRFLTLMRISNLGSNIWCTSSPALFYESVLGMVSSGNEFYISTSVNGVTQQLYKYSSSGLCIWARTISIPNFIHYGWVYNMTISNGKLCTVGTARNLGGYMEGHIEEYDTSGNLLNSGFLFTGVNTDLNDVTYNAAGDIVLTGSVRTGFIASDTLSMYLTVGDLSTGTICGYFPFPFTVAIDTPLVASSVSLPVTTTGTMSSFTMLTSTGSLIQIGCIVGIQESTTSLVHLYPNPANDVLTVEIPFGGGTFQLYNNLGQSVITEKLFGSRNEISVAMLAEGVYYYNIVDENGKVFSDKLVIE